MRDGQPATTRFDVEQHACLGSQQGNAHLHWHVAPLPPGVPYHQQQFHALMAENGVLDVDDAAQAALARTIRIHFSVKRRSNRDVRFCLRWRIQENRPWGMRILRGRR